MTGRTGRTDRTGRIGEPGNTDGACTGGRQGSARRRLWWLVGGVVAANLVLRGLWVGHYRARPVSDFATYYGAASRWADGGGYTLDGEHATVAWPPGWPMVLRLLFEVTGPSVSAGVVVQVVLSAVTGGLVVLLAHRCSDSLRLALLAGLFFTAQPADWARNSVLGTEPLFGLLLTAGLFTLLGKPVVRGAVATGLLWGAATLVRGTQLLAFPLVGLVALMRGLGWRRAATVTLLTALASVVVLAPWTIRNATVTGEFVPVSSNLGQNLWQGTRTDIGYWWSDDPAENPVLLAHTEVENDRIGRAAAFEYWREHPGEFLLRAPVKISGLYAGNAEAFYWLHRTAEMTGSVKERWNAVADLAYWSVMGFALGGAFALCRQGWGRQGWGRDGSRQARAVAVALLGTVLYTTAVFTWFPTWDRFRAPLMPVFCILAAYGIRYLWRPRHRSQQ